MTGNPVSDSPPLLDRVPLSDRVETDALDAQDVPEGPVGYGGSQTAFAGLKSQPLAPGDPGFPVFGHPQPPRPRFIPQYDDPGDPVVTRWQAAA